MFVPGKEAEGEAEARIDMMYCPLCRKHRDRPTGLALGTTDLRKSSLQDHHKSAKHVAAQKAQDDRLIAPASA